MTKVFFCSLFGVMLFVAAATANCPDWTGLYVGGQFGRGWAHAHWKYLNGNPYDSNGPGEPILGAKNNFSRSNVVGGAQIGFNYQYRSFLAGIEGACAAGGFSEKKFNVVSIFPSSDQIVKVDFSPFAMGVGRIGYLLLPEWLIYAKGGYAGARVKTRGQTIPPITGLILDWSTSKWHNGWVVGAGLEYMAYSFITVALEYDYVSLDKLKHVGSVSGGAIGPGDQVEHSVKANLQTLMVRLNFIIW
jgi:outer membrane immunogenic protein